MDQQRILVLTGNGKGKTSSAFGMALRALGHNKKVVVIQFIKHDGSYGEVTALRSFPGAEVHCCGLGFTPKQSDSPKWELHTAAAQQGWNLAQKALKDSGVDMVILDEIFYPISYDFFNEDDVVEALTKAPKTQSIIMTGRNAPEKLMNLADTVSIIDSPKHAYQQGIKAQQGFEF